ncbi:superoxide dismutase [Cu-Zn] SodC [Chimaeribacter arupi]|uniref:superoxide dismutase [Cu-Zn] SodC n=1 Tax=Chimaeribacter arupi TaxID=2060066 RepID=UPI002946E83D|nr:superoxide dismutase [Cu-Zn] SodC [Chimaeribacter arupi]MDV5140110.1 superoxide dismutase [Cu-Zn] SodC [Chimaeribacter arupi]
MKSLSGVALAAIMVCGAAQAASKDVTMNLVSAEGEAKPIGTITISETQYGLLFTPTLTSLPPGVHGFHVHQNGSCDAGMKDGKKVAAQAAGDHFDPGSTGKHLGPYQEGHLGDLPVLFVHDDGSSSDQVLAPRLKKLSEIDNKALMIHAGGDNHADMPMPLGGGGGRIACGVI